MQHAKPVGIDLGTTNSAVACVDESGRSVMVPSSEGDLLTPSIVLFDDAEVVVGKEARTYATVNPERVAEWVKRDMGSPVYSHPIRGELLPPEVIQACILRKLKADLVRAEGPDCQVVITVPAYFDEPRRKATADAGEMAGLSVLDIVNEPTAAALSFAETAGFLTPGGTPGEEMTVLVFDLGGGTFDVTVLKLAKADVQTLATDGDVQLGGHDWDGRLVDWLAEAFLAAHHVDLRRDPAGVSRLYQAAVEAKHTLSARNRAAVRLEHAGDSVELKITRRQFNEMTADLLERTAYTTREMMQAAGLKFTDLTRVLLVGGSTRMPMVDEMLRKLTGIAADHTVNPDEAVARGAALYAAHLLARRAEGGPPPAFRVTDVNAHSLGVEGIDQQTMRKTNVILIPRNTRLPAKAAEQFVTKTQGQRSIVVQVLQGESSLPGECTAIGRTVVRDLPQGLPQGYPVEVTFEYGSNGRLSVRTAVPGTNQQAALELQRATGLTDQRIARWKQPVVEAAGFGTFESAAGESTAGRPKAGKPKAGKPKAGKPKAGQAAGAPAAVPAGSDLPAAAASPTTAGTASPPQPASPPVASSQPPSQPAAAARVPAAAPRPSQSRRPSGFSGRAAREPGVPRWAVNLIGYVTSAVVGLGAGYLVLHLLRPDSFPLPW